MNPTVDSQAEFVEIECGGEGSRQLLITIPLVAPADFSGVVVNLTQVREFHYRRYRGEALEEWRLRYPNARRIETQRDLERLRIWPLFKNEHPGREIVETLAHGCQEVSAEYDHAEKVALSDLRAGLRFEEGAETTILKYPEIIALIDGSPFRFPEAYFIGDMEAVACGELPSRNADWFRGFDGLPERWNGCVCEICGHDRSDVQHVIGPSRIVRCRDCGLEYDNPRAVVPKCALDKYASPVRDARKSAKSLVRAEQNAAILVEGLRAIEPDLVGKPLLDIGCASGETLYVLRERYGWSNGSLWGVDPSPLAAEIAQKTYGLNICCIAIEEGDSFAERSFRIVTFFNTIEHITKPAAVLGRMQRLLAPGGYVLLATVPSVASVASLAFPEGFIAKNFPDGQHRYQYTPETLSRLCRRAGFDIVRLDGDTRDTVMGMVRETALWLAQSCGVPLTICRHEEEMLRDLKERIQRLQARLKRQRGTEHGFSCTDADFESVEALVAFWQREIWSSPFVSDEFDIWLKKPVGKPRRLA